MIMEPKTRLYDEAGKKVRKPIVQSKPREDVDKEVKLSMRMASYRKQKLDAVALTDMLHASTLVVESKGSAEGGRTAGDDTIFLQSLRLEAEELNKRKLLSAEVEEYEEAARYKREVNKVLAKIAHIEGGPAPTSSRARGASKLINKDWAESSPETTPVSMDSSPALSRTRSPRPVPRGRVSSISSICSPISSIGSTFSRSSSGVGGDNGELSEEEMRMIRESFAKVCARYATTDLSKRAFVSLVKQLCKQSGQKTLPSDKDLDIAFVLADVDKNGTVDLDEFMHMFELVKKGEVRGLAGNNLTNSSPRSKDGLAKKQEKFQLQVSSGAESRKAARERANQGIEEAGDEDRQHIQAEDTLRREGYHGRDMISETLHNASDEWNRRQASGNGNTTKAVKLGNYANTTSNSTHQQDRHLSRVEMELKASKDERDTMSLELEKAKVAYKKRLQGAAVKKFRAVDTDKSGSLDLQEVLAGADLLNLGEEQAREWFEELDVDKSGDIDMDEFLAVYHERHTTVAEDIGRLAVTTEASKSRNKDNTGSIHARLQASLESTKQSEAFKKRQQAPAIKKFRAIDTDKSGSLDLQEVLAGASLLDLSEEEARAWFEELDVDKSGEVDMEAFLAVHHERTSTVAEDIGRLGKGTAASIAGQREKAGTSI